MGRGNFSTETFLFNSISTARWQRHLYLNARLKVSGNPSNPNEIFFQLFIDFRVLAPATPFATSVVFNWKRHE